MFFFSINLGLVYGPPDKTVKWTIFVFCNISIFSFFIETVQNADDLNEKRKLPFLTQSLTNFIVIIFEDIPLLALNLMITMCRDGEPTVISVIKASVCLAVVFIRVILLLSRYWLLESKKSRFNFVLDIMSTIGLISIALMSIGIQLLKNFPINSNGEIQATSPVHFNRMDFVTNKYLKNVGIFIRWPIERDPNDFSDSKYIWLADITDVIDNTYLQIKVNLNRDSTNGNFFLCFDKPSANQTCFSTPTIALSSYFSRANISHAEFNYLQEYTIAITKEPAQDYRYLVGYLDFNIQKVNYTQNKPLPVECQNCRFKLIYAKFAQETDISEKSFLRNNFDSGFSFWSTVDLSTVDKIWRTGAIGCKMNGDLGPKLNADFQIIN